MSFDKEFLTLHRHTKIKYECEFYTSCKTSSNILLRHAGKISQCYGKNNGGICVAAAGMGWRAAAVPTRQGGIIVPDLHTTNAIAALYGTQPLRHWLSGS